jgi:phage replication-related protein YjqB (UPF0714/DUF867 family)
MVVFADLLATSGVHEQWTLRSRVGFLALHGGLEEGTAEIARAAAEHGGASCYALVQPPELRWHVPSHRFDPDASPALDAVLTHCELVISLHGYGRRELATVLLAGGGDRSLAAALATHLREALPAYDVRDDVASIPEGLRGLDPRNPVNRTRGGGVQLELPPRVRGTSADAAALVRALASFATQRAG